MTAASPGWGDDAAAAPPPVLVQSSLSLTTQAPEPHGQHRPTQKSYKAVAVVQGGNMQTRLKTKTAATARSRGSCQSR